MGVLSIIEVVLGLLQGVLSATKVGGAATPIITSIENAIAELEKVRGTDVTKAQLESMRVTPQW